MIRRMWKLDMLRREIKAALRLSPLLLAVLLLTVILGRSDSEAVSGLFQSSPSPIETPTVAPLPPTAPPIPASPTLAPTIAVPGTAQPTVTLPFETPTLPLTPTVEFTPTPFPTVTIEATPTRSPTVIFSEAAPATAGTPGAPGTEGSTPDDRQRYADEDSSLRFDLATLFDSTALFLSYVWLCCGGLVFLSIPVLFAALWVASKRRHQQKE